jgi:hypothetical protein
VGRYSICMNEPKTEIVSQTRLARLAAKRINDWLYDEQLDRLHDICHEVVTSEHPNLDPDALWDVLPEVFDRLRPFTVG